MGVLNLPRGFSNSTVKAKTAIKCRYRLSIVNGEIEITVIDIKFAASTPTFFHVSSKELAELIGPLQERLISLWRASSMTSNNSWAVGQTV